MRSFTYIVVIFIATWFLSVNAQDKYRDEIDKVRNKYIDEIVEYAAKPCYTALLNDTKLLAYASDRKEVEEAVKQVIIQVAYSELANMIKGTSAKYRSDTYQRYANYCTKTFRRVVRTILRLN